MMDLLEKAITIAVEAHQGDVDKAGRPYILHPLHLMMQMKSEEEMITAVLHDVVEDSHFTLTDLKAEGFAAPILTALALLTHDKTGVSYEAYIAAIKTNPLARRVKLADLAHNMDVRRLTAVNRKTWKRLQKYRRAWETLRSQKDTSLQKQFHHQETN